MKALSKLTLALISITITLSTLLYMGCEGDDDNVDKYFNNNPYKTTPNRKPFTDPPSSVNLSITPTSASVNSGQLIGFQATGGSSPYSWSVGISAHGNITPQSNSKYAVYTHIGSSADINNIIVTDSAGAVAIANIN